MIQQFNSIFELFDELLGCLSDQKKAGKIKELKDEWELTLKNDDDVLTEKLNPDLVFVYKELANGFIINWVADDENDIRGRMHFLSIKNLFYDRKGTFYNEEDIEKDRDICYFKPLDLITEEAECGIYINPKDSEYRNKCIYYYDASDLEIHNLDLDFRGYLEMAFEAKIFFYWPKVLLDIQSNSESPETKRFKTEMPKLFPDFNWDAFVEKYESLRLSKNEKFKQ